MSAPAAPPRKRRPPIDPRLWRYCLPARRYLVVTIVLSLVVTAAIVVSATMIGTVLGGVITDPDRRGLSDWTVHLVVLAVALAVRVGASWLQARYGDRVATQVIAQLQGDVLDAAVTRSPRELDTHRDEAATVLTKGMADLRPYLSGYVPALLLSVVVPPIVLIAIALQDVVSALIIAFTLPLIPVFMVLIGLLTRGRAQQTLAAMTTLSSQLLDLLAGLPTLRALGRERGPQHRVTELGESHRERAMSALRIAFLSGMVLELLATLCVALVAVSIGLRLVFGNMALTAGIIALILAPEVYQPLRTVGERFHAAEDGLAAADRAFTLLDERASQASGSVRPSSVGRIVVRDLAVASRDGMAPSGLSAECAPGTVTVLTGPNGSGKSTVLQAILGLIETGLGLGFVGRMLGGRRRPRLVVAAGRVVAAAAGGAGGDVAGEPGTGRAAGRRSSRGGGGVRLRRGAPRIAVRVGHRGRHRWHRAVAGATAAPRADSCPGLGQAGAAARRADRAPRR